MADIFTMVVGIIRVVLGFFFLFFVPGFAITLALYPRLPDIPAFKRIVLSTVISIGSVIIAVLFLDIVLGVDTTPVNIILIILAISVFTLLIWLIELLYLNRKDNKKIKVFFPKIN
jgi:uncharacterized membrane protein